MDISENISIKPSELGTTGEGGKGGRMEGGSGGGGRAAPFPKSAKCSLDRTPLLCYLGLTAVHTSSIVSLLHVSGYPLHRHGVSSIQSLVLYSGYPKGDSHKGTS